MCFEKIPLTKDTFTDGEEYKWNKFRNKNIWKQNREQLIYIGRRNIKIDVILREENW